MNNAVIEQVVGKIGAIPASGGGAMDLVPATLRNKLSDQLMRRIAEIAVEEVGRASYPIAALTAERQKYWDPHAQLTVVYYSNELAGEVGEACNVAKKIERERLGLRGSRDTVEHLAEELADVIICAANLAWRCGIDLFGDSVPKKFNASSEKLNLPVKWKW